MTSPTDYLIGKAIEAERARITAALDAEKDIANQSVIASRDASGVIALLAFDIAIDIVNQVQP